MGRNRLLGKGYPSDPAMVTAQDRAGRVERGFLSGLSSVPVRILGPEAVMSFPSLVEV